LHTVTQTAHTLPEVPPKRRRHDISLCLNERRKSEILLALEKNVLRKKLPHVVWIGRDGKNVNRDDLKKLH